jgi:hypothetical protein
LRLMEGGIKGAFRLCPKDYRRLTNACVNPEVTRLNLRAIH